MVSYFIEVQKRGDRYAIYLWRSTWLSGTDIIRSEYRDTKGQMDHEVEIMKANKDKYIKEYEDGLKEHRYINL